MTKRKIQVRTDGKLVYEKAEDRPEIVLEAYLDYLDALREAGVENMFGVGPYLQEEFTLLPSEARVILAYWMKTFGTVSR